MSARDAIGKRTIAILMGMTMLAPTWAIDIPDLLDDPLWTRQQTFETSARLPRDELASICPPAVDLAQPLSLDDVVDVALCNHPQIQAAWAAVKQQASAVGEARAAYLPTLNSTTSRLNNRVRYPDFPANNSQSKGQTVYANLVWRLFDFGGREANRDVANHLLIGALLSHDATIQKILVAVVGAYFDVLTTQAANDARREASSLAQQTVEATLRRAKRGMAAQSDTLQASVALAKAKLAEQRALGDHRKAMALLVAAMALPPSTPIRLAPSPELPKEAAQQGLEYWLQETAERHPAILAARAQWAAARSKVEVTRGEGLPTLDFTSNYYRNGYPNQGLQTTHSNTTTWGLTLTIPLFEGFARTYKIRGAQAQAEQSAAQIAEVENQVMLDVIKAHADAVSALANLASSDTLLAASQASLASSEKRYAKGVADILELLAVLSALTDAQQERVRCVSEWRSARLRLMANAGILGRQEFE